MTRVKPWSRVGALVLDGVLALVFLGLVGELVWGGLAYRFGFDLFERTLQALFAFGALRLAVVAPWARVKLLPASQLAFVAGVTLLLGWLTYRAVVVNLRQAMEATVLTRIAFPGSSDDEIWDDITEHSLWYPRMATIREWRELIPEDASVAYIGDQRPHMVAYLLYPRKVYSLPELQDRLNRAIEDAWAWIETSDPLFPKDDPLNSVDEGLPQDRFDEEVQAALREMIADNEIEYVVFYNSVSPDRSWLYRLPRRGVVP